MTARRSARPVRRLPKALSIAIAIAAAGSAVAGTPLYHLRALSAPGASSVAGLDINDSGQIVGRYLDQDFNSIAAFWDADGTAHALSLPGTGDGAAYAINNKGQIVGTFNDYQNPQLGLLWNANAPSQWTNLSSDPSVYVQPSDINDAGVIVGGFGLPAAERAFVWTAQGGLVDYGLEDPNEEFQQVRWSAVNASGKLIGHWNVHSSDIHAVVGQAGTPAVLPMGDMSTTFPTAATALNASGLTVGLGLAASTPNLVPVVFADDGSYTEIDNATLDQDNGCAAAINDAGTITGSAGIGSASGCVAGLKAWVYRDGTVYDLASVVDDLGPFTSLKSGLAINSAGVILGVGETADGTGTFVLEPLLGDRVFADGFDGVGAARPSAHF